MPLLILLSDLIGGVLDALGGFHWLFARRYIMPFLFGCVASATSYVHTHSLLNLWIGVLCLPAMGTFTLGYPKGDLAGNSGRGLWLFIQAVALSLGLAAFNHLQFNVDWWFIHLHSRWIIFVIYIIFAGLFGGIYKNWKQTLGDFVTGTYLGTILFFVR